MNKISRTIILVLVALFLFYNYFSRSINKPIASVGIADEAKAGASRTQSIKPQIAIIFDGLGDSLKDLRQIRSLRIPVTISIIPGLRFSKNIAYMAHRCNFSVLTGLPLEPEGEYDADGYEFISSMFSQRKIDALLRRYLNYLRIAVGVNSYMGSKATQDVALMEVIVKALKQRGLVFIDSATTPDSCGFDLAKKIGIAAASSAGFLDLDNSKEKIREKLYELLDLAKNKKAIVIMAHPYENTLEVLRQELTRLKGQVEFVTIEDYLEL